MTPVSENSSILLADDYQSINQKLLRLTDREWDVLSLMTDGLTTAEIASCLVIEPKSIENYKRRISKKLKIGGRSNLVKFCIVNRDYLRKLYLLVHK
jgi:DNA-binding NarL/FixJ family response regulator